MAKKPNAGSSARRTTASKRATLRTISELTGLSLSTVSLSLRGGGGLKEETRKKVADAAKLVGYVPDRAGVRLRTGKTNVIALVLDGADESIDFARQLISGIGDAIKGTRYHLTVTPEFDRIVSVESIRYILDNRTADGVIITHTGPHDRRVQLLMENDFPFVSHGRTEFFTQHPFHDFHSENFASGTVEHLVSKGCKDLMLIIGDDSTMNYANIVRAFERTATKLKVQSRVVHHKTAASASEELRQFGREIATRADRPDGILCDSELRSISLLRGLEEGGAKVGTDIQFICKQTSGIVPTIFPGIETVEEDVYAAGVELTQLLLRRIDGEPAEALQTLSEPVFHWRN